MFKKYSGYNMTAKTFKIKFDDIGNNAACKLRRIFVHELCSSLRYSSVVVDMFSVLFTSKIALFEN